jgi:SNF2 family DNA or RNA helicase
LILNIKYQHEEQSAELSLHPSSNTVWPHIRRIFEEATGDTCNLSVSSLTTPWWALLSCRDGLAYVINQHAVRLKLDKASENFLRQALARKAGYDKALSARPISKVLLTRKLKVLGFQRQLTKEQVRNVRVLAALDAGATFSVPGAGKTTEALAYFMLRGKARSRLLVVTPKNAFAVWEEQVRLCIKTPLTVIRLQGGSHAVQAALRGGSDVMLITYQQLSVVKSMLAEYMSLHSCFMFLDESHRMKRGTEGLHGSTVLGLSHLPIAKLIMSGTPLPNSVDDLLPQFAFLYPEVQAIQANIKDLIRPIYVRTTKSELNLPAIRRRIIKVRMRPKQRQLYELLSSEVARHGIPALKAGDRNALRALGRSATRLLQLSSNPLLLNSLPFQQTLLRGVLEEGDSPKLRYVCERVRYLASKQLKSIVWSTFVPNVELLANRLKDLGADYIHGGVEAGSEDEAETRENKIMRFHEDPDAWVLVANPAACGESISLHKVCHHAIYMDRNYNAAQYLQSEDRIHRLGLEKNAKVVVEIVTASDSIDECVHRRLQQKIALMGRALSDPSLTIEATSVDLDDEELDDEDLADFIRHVKKR